MARGFYQDPLAQLVSGVLIFLLAAGLLLQDFVSSRESDAVGLKVMLYCLGVFYGSLSVGRWTLQCRLSAVVQHPLL